MNSRLGTVFSALVIDENNTHYMAQIDGVTYKINKDEAVCQIGEMVRGFGYENQKGQAIMTTNLPTIRQNRYDFATVTQVRKDLGVFVDIGLPDKEIVVSLDILPSEKNLWPKKGDQLFIALSVDKKNRLWGQLASDEILAQLATPISRKNKAFHNKMVTGIVYHPKLVGSYVLTPDFHLAFIHEKEFEVEPRLGEKIEGRVIGIGQNGNLNVSLKPRAHEMISDDAAMILALLKRQPNHFLPYHDKSDPEAIRQFFNISKAQFKRAIGNLLKNNKITQSNEGIHLK